MTAAEAIARDAEFPPGPAQQWFVRAADPGQAQHRHDTYPLLVAEIERLTQDREQAWSDLTAARAEVLRLEAENEALREAGEGLAKTAGLFIAPFAYDKWSTDYVEQRQARAALARWREVAGEKFGKADL